MGHSLCNEAEEKSKSGKARLLFRFVPLSDIFTNQFLEDLDKIWELRHWIPDPTKAINPHEYHKRIFANS